MKRNLLFFSLFASFAMVAQEYDTLYFTDWDTHFSRSTTEQATFYMLLPKPPDIVKSGLVKSYYISGEDHGFFNYKDGKIEGSYEIYHKTGGLRFVGEYKQEQRVGLQKEWFKNGQLKEEKIFLVGLPGSTSSIETQISNSWDSLGNEMVVKGTGPHIDYHTNGQKAHEGKYLKGNKSSTWRGYFDDGLPHYVESYSDGKLIEGESYDDNENVYSYTEFQVQGEFPGGIKTWSRFLKRNLKYPRNARRAGIEGRVFISFIMKKDGSITEAEVVRGIGGGCDQESLRVINLSPKWIPSRQRGQNIETRFSIAIEFRLR